MKTVETYGVILKYLTVRLVCAVFCGVILHYHRKQILGYDTVYVF
jgi:hypothetical protein